jgi:hypothetical protein
VFGINGGGWFFVFINSFLLENKKKIQIFLIFNINTSKKHKKKHQFKIFQTKNTFKKQQTTKTLTNMPKF